MKKTIILAALAIIALSGCAPKAELERLRVEYQAEPINIDCTSPRFSWEYCAAEDSQTAYRVTVAADSGFSELVWDSGWQESAESMVVWHNAGLESFSDYFWKVQTRMASGRTLQSSVQSFSTTAMPGYVWQAQWITDSHDMDFEPAPMLRRSFEISGKVSKATLCISAAAYYKLWINGQDPTGGVVLDPGYTHYDKRNLYSTYDVTDVLCEGENVIAAVLGNGFYNEIDSVATWQFEKARWRGRARMKAQLNVSYADGTSEVIPTDASFRTATGPYLINNIYSGDVYDARLEIPGWQNAGFDDSAWAQATVVDDPSPLFRSQGNPPVRKVEVLSPVEVKNLGDTVYFFDFGKNISGTTSVTFSGEAGTRVELVHGEVLDSTGRLDMDNIAMYFYPKEDMESQTDIYYMKGGEEESFEALFNYHGFRYVEVRSSSPIKIASDGIKAYFVHTDVEPAGTFECSEPLLNKIYEAAKLSYLGNLESIPTDCPHREKNGWTADANLAMELGLTGFDGLTFYEKWVNDMLDNQAADGNVSGIVPTDKWGYEDWIGPVWAAAFFMIPDILDLYYNDTRAIETLYGTMARYLAYLAAREDADGTVTYGIGDWVYYDTPTPTDYTTSVFYYWMNVLMWRFSDMPGRDGSAYTAKAASLRDLINRRFFDPDRCRYANGSQASYAVALAFGLPEEKYRKALADQLNQMIADNGYYLDFGSLGSKYVPRVLADAGYAGTVYKMATKTDKPSWGAWIESGKTALGENWRVDLENEVGLSGNHVFLGDIAAWMVNYLAGIKPCREGKGFSRILIEPCIVEGLDYAKAGYHSVKGMVTSEWHRTGDRVVLEISVPANTTAVVNCGALSTEVGGGYHKFEINQ